MPHFFLLPEVKRSRRRRFTQDIKKAGLAEPPRATWLSVIK